jgi:hypothetical protein
MTVFAGVRKLSDVAAIVTELSIVTGSNTGSFYLVAGADSAFSYSAISRGDAASNINQLTGSTAAAPNTAVITNTHDIAGDLTTFRRNRVVAPNATGNKGAGNFGNYPLFIGARNSSSLFFSGNIYSLIIRGALSSDAQIINSETYVNSKTGAY